MIKLKKVLNYNKDPMNSEAWDADLYLDLWNPVENTFWFTVDVLLRSFD